MTKLRSARSVLAAASGLRRLWEAEVDVERAAAPRWLPWAASLVLVLYVLTELLVLEPVGDLLTLDELPAAGPLAPWQWGVWLGWLLLTFVVRVTVGTIGYFVADGGLDRVRFRGNLMVYLPAGAIQVAALFLAAAVAGTATAREWAAPPAEWVAWIEGSPLICD